MDIKAGNGYPAGALSNFARRGFVIDGIEYQSMEAIPTESQIQKRTNAKRNMQIVWK